MYFANDEHRPLNAEGVSAVSEDGPCNVFGDHIEPSDDTLADCGTSIPHVHDRACGIRYTEICV